MIRALSPEIIIKRKTAIMGNTIMMVMVWSESLKTIMAATILLADDSIKTQ